MWKGCSTTTFARDYLHVSGSHVLQLQLVQKRDSCRYAVRPGGFWLIAHGRIRLIWLLRYPMNSIRINGYRQPPKQIW